MKLQNIVLLLCCVPFASFAADRTDGARTGVGRVSMVASRLPAMVTGGVVPSTTGTPVVEKKTDVNSGTPGVEPVNPIVKPDDKETGDCRDAYRECMDQFCLLDESEGYRCACSDNINQSKKLIQEIQQIQEEADKLYTEGVEREKLGTKAALVFGESDAAKKSSRLSGISFTDWLNGTNSDGDLMADEEIGDNLYALASEYCAAELKNCPDKVDMEELLYSRQIISDCKAYGTYLAEQKTNAQANKRTAESAVRAARLEMLNRDDETNPNRYNRGECLLAYKSCISDKGGCGVNFENCLDASLLDRRAYACENVLNQCVAVKKDVQSDWTAESEYVLAEAAKYVDKNQRVMCNAKVQDCLEQGCSLETNSLCLSDVNIAIGICPIISECDEKIPGYKRGVAEQLAGVRVKFCENDLDACLKDKCGVNFTAPECVGKNAREIADTLCPKSEFMACNHMKDDQFEVIVSSAMLHMDYQILVGCINQFAEKLGAVCGTDMSCLPISELMNAKDEDGNVLAMDKWIDLDSVEGKALQSAVQKSADVAVDNFFQDFEKDLTLSACRDVYSESKNKKRSSMEDSVNTSAKMEAYQRAENRALRELMSLMDKKKMEQETNREHKYCLKRYQEESAPKVSQDDANGYSYIRSVSYEPALHNCHICRMQRVCETGGESKTASALKSAAGGLSGGAAIGTMVTPGWGTLIGGGVGAIGAGILGAASGGEKTFCQELESCEDVNVGDITEEMLKDL